MRVELAPGINAASGTFMKCKNGTRIIFTTRRAPSSNPCKVRMYLRYADDYQRSTPVSEREMQVRSIFSRRHARVLQLLAENPKLSKKKAWQIAKTEIKDLLSFD